jgi:hypothetical protein
MLLSALIESTLERNKVVISLELFFLNKILIKEKNIEFVEKYLKKNINLLPEQKIFEYFLIENSISIEYIKNFFINNEALFSLPREALLLLLFFKKTNIGEKKRIFNMINLDNIVSNNRKYIKAWYLFAYNNYLQDSAFFDKKKDESIFLNIYLKIKGDSKIDTCYTDAMRLVSLSIYGKMNANNEYYCFESKRLNEYDEPRILKDVSGLEYLLKYKLKEVKNDAFEYSNPKLMDIFFLYNVLLKNRIISNRKMIPLIKKEIEKYKEHALYPLLDCLYNNKDIDSDKLNSNNSEYYHYLIDDKNYKYNEVTFQNLIKYNL